MTSLSATSRRGAVGRGVGCGGQGRVEDTRSLRDLAVRVPSHRPPQPTPRPTAPRRDYSRFRELADQARHRVGLLELRRVTGLLDDLEARAWQAARELVR